MEVGPKCWVCLRSPDEVRATVGDDTTDETRIRNSLQQIAQLRSKFAKSSELWSKSVPEGFMGIDLQFILENASQFETIKFLPELRESLSLLQRLGKALKGLRTNDPVALEVVNLPSSREEEREVLAEQLHGFEEKSRRRLEGAGGGGTDAQFIEGLAGLSLAGGLEYLRAGGLFYFDVQTSLLEWERSMLITENPKFQVGFIRLDGIPEVPLCGVCQGLLGKTQDTLNAVQLPQGTESVARMPLREASRQPSDLLTIGLVVTGVVELVIVLLLAIH